MAVTAGREYGLFATVFGRELSISTLDLHLETKGMLFSTSPKPFNPFGL
jgi:hypothetical protein